MSTRSKVLIFGIVLTLAYIGAVVLSLTGGK